MLKITEIVHFPADFHKKSNMEYERSKPSSRGSATRANKDKEASPGRQ